jgi:predicted GNAT family N-acyltransferase
MAVLQEWRGCGIGNALMACLLDRAVSLDISRLQLSAQYHAIGFYKQFGFEPIGSVYEEAGIDHIRMVKDLNA